MQRLDLNTTTATPDVVCAECGKQMDCASGPGAPEPGDFSLCIGCASLNVFDAQLHLRAPTHDEMLAASADADVQTLRRAILAVNARRG